MGMEPPEIMTTIRARSPIGSAAWKEADDWLKEYNKPDDQKIEDLGQDDQVGFCQLSQEDS